MDCEHNYQFQGVVYGQSTYPRPGSGAHDRIYWDRYYCTKCLDVEDKNRREMGTTYDKPIPGSFPK